jgi:hypothetical protein
VGKIKAGRIEQYSKGLIEHRTADERKKIMKLVIQIENRTMVKHINSEKLSKSAGSCFFYNRVKSVR